MRLSGGPEVGFRTTDHSGEIAWLRALAGEGPPLRTLSYLLASDLLEAHDETGISLDDWVVARTFVETLLEGPILPNGV